MQRLEQILHKGIYPNEHYPYEGLYSLINHQKTHMVYHYLAIKGRQWKRPLQLLVRVWSDQSPDNCWWCQGVF